MTAAMRALALFTAVLVALAPILHAAGDQPAVFIHGLASSGATWDDAAGRLAARTTIAPATPDLNWSASYEDQARALQSSPELAALGLGTIAIGHSNGGVVAREWSKLRHLDGIVTIGTPHAGAPLIPHLRAWADFNVGMSGLLNAALAAFSYNSPWVWVYGYVKDMFDWAYSFSVWSVVDLGLTIGFNAAAPVTFEMVPGSPYLLGLDSFANVNREANAVPARVGIVSIAHNYYWAGPARAIAPQDADDIATAMYAAAFGLVYWSGYIAASADPSDFASTEQSITLADVAGQILSIDPLYCRMVSTPDLSACFPNDGVVPDESQSYPGAPNLRIGDDNDGPAHIQETEQSDDALYDALVTYVHVPPRTAGSPPISLPPPPGPAPAPSDTPAFPDEVGSSTSDDAGGTAPGEPVTPVPTPGPSPVGLPGVLGPMEGLVAGQDMYSQDGRYHFIYQWDGNLVLYNPAGQPIWASHTDGTSPGGVAMQGDGNFVMYDASGRPIWAESAGLGHPGAYFVVQNDGNLVIAADGIALWASNTVEAGQ